MQSSSTITKLHPSPSRLDVRLVTERSEQSALRTIARSRAARVALAAGLVVVGFWKVWSYRALVEAPSLTENDFTPDYVSAKEWRAGRDAYAPLPEMNLRHLGPQDPTARQYERDQLNPHPPALVLFHAPLSAFDIRSARAIQMGLELLAISLAVFLFCRALLIRRAMAAALAIGALALPIVAFDLRWGQVNGLVLLGLVLAWRALRSDRDVAAGVILGAVIGLKVFPILLLIPLIRMRRTKAIASTVASALGVTLLGTVAFGLDATIRFATEASSRNFEIWGASPHSISLVSLPFRLIAPGRWLTPGAQIPAIVGLLGIVAFIACCLAAWRTSAAASGDLFWAATPWMILASPIAWAHYLVLLIPLGILMLRKAVREPSRPLGIPVAIVLIALGSSLLDGAASIFGFSVQRYGNVVAGMTVTMAALIMTGMLDGVPAPARGLVRRFVREREIVLP